MNMTAGEPVEPLFFLSLTYPATDVRYFKTKYAHKPRHASMFSFNMNYVSG